MDKEEKIKRRRGEHLNKNEVKTEILKYVLDNNSPVLEPYIREHLKEKLNISDTKTMKSHFSDLQELQCIKKIGNKGLENEWKIDSLKQLKNIREKFPEIKLNTYDKSLNIILKEWDYSIESINGFKFYIRLLLSTSFFDECMTVDIETLISRAWKIYLFEKGFNENQVISEYLNDCYVLYVKKHPISELAKETFFEKMKEMVPKFDEIPTWEVFINKVEKTFQELSGDITLKRIEEFLKKEEEFLKNENISKSDNLISKDLHLRSLEEIFLSQEKWNAMLPNVLSEIYKKYPKTTEEDENSSCELYKKMYNTIELIWRQRLNFDNICFELLFEHYLYQDILKGVDTPDELEFAKKTKLNLSQFCDVESYDFELGDSVEERRNKWILDDLKQVSIIMAKYKQPSIFDNKVYDNPDDIYHALKSHFSFLFK